MTETQQTPLIFVVKMLGDNSTFDSTVPITGAAMQLARRVEGASASTLNNGGYNVGMTIPSTLDRRLTVEYFLDAVARELGYSEYTMIDETRGKAMGDDQHHYVTATSAA